MISPLTSLRHELLLKRADKCDLILGIKRSKRFRIPSPVLIILFMAYDARQIDRSYLNLIHSVTEYRHTGR